MNSILGIAVIFIVAYLVSTNRKAIRWRTVIGAFAIQVILAGFVLYIPIGRELLFSFRCNWLHAGGHRLLVW